ncbi:regulator of G-protein signaling 17-like isoform X2 [Rhineura floridana]|uniref:regulator of G-protein signaling 17-like isoform X2 n=1 Tax=Rhineura floridana TaxID=261503 RepID=UPI002AC816CF|nr:regulator of G-protein signaling 17-like isoform X2 [Rhineura floridana]
MESRSPEKSHPLSETTRKSLCCCRRSSHCCFCWRCCTWNRMARKRRRDGIGCKVSSISHLESPLNLEERLTAEETTSWQRSFDCMLARPSGRHIFMEFLKTEHSDENMSFWLACEDLKKEQNPELISEKAKKIYLDYISILSPKEVSIDAAVRETINNSLLSPSAHMFDEAQAQVYALMHRDSYPRNKEKSGTRL